MQLNKLIEGLPRIGLFMCCRNASFISRSFVRRRSRQANRKTREGADNPDRDAQFRVVNDAVKAAMAENQPAISVDTKKKELVGDFKNAGREWRRQGDPEEVDQGSRPRRALWNYDLAANAGWVNVGVDNDTASFAVQTIRRWWQEVGRIRYPLAR